MTPARHARKIFNEIKVQGIIKYLRGQREHGGRLWEIPIPTLIGFAKEEVLDQGSYLWTVDELIDKLKSNCLALFASLEGAEEPLSLEDRNMISDIKALLGES